MSAVNTSLRVALKARQPVAEATVAFRIEKPAGFAFKPGQAVELGRPEPSSPAKPTTSPAWSSRSNGSIEPV